MNGLLPIGSVVLLKGGKKRVMVCGRMQIDNSTKKPYTYSGYLYPEGIINSDEMVLFNNEDIEKLYFIGFQDEEELELRNYIAEKIKEAKENDDE